MRLVYLSLLFVGLPACMIIGDPKDPNDTATATSGPDVTSEPATTGTTGGTTELITTTSPTTGVTTTSPTTGGPVCDGLDELACPEQPGCQAIFGAPLDFPGCTSSPAYLGCIEQTDCGLMETVVCRDNSLEVYQVSDTCFPPGYTACDSMLPACGTACFGIDEAACAENPSCSPHLGAPHIVQGGTICVDYNNLEFLACDVLQDPCPPVVLTVCPIGQPDIVFEVSSGCTPPGFETCMGDVVPECP